MQQQSGSQPRDPAGGSRRRPRVVILDAGDRATVAVLDLPELLDIGGRFCHSGTWWRICGQRPGSRVFIAAPESSSDQDPGSTI
jgi:hypothetical protein